MDGRHDPDASFCTVTAAGVVELVGEHDVASAPEFEAALKEAAKQSVGSVEVDLTRATFIDSSIAAVLVRSARDLVRGGHRIALRLTEGSSPAVVIEIVGLGSQAGIVVETVPASDGG
jgi:anti-anti-sigma factor